MYIKNSAREPQVRESAARERTASESAASESKANESKTNESKTNETTANPSIHTDPTPSESFNWKKLLTLFALGILVYLGMRYLLVPVIPFLLGWALASWILPLAKWFERRLRIKRGVAGGLLVGAATLAIALLTLCFANLLLKQLSSFGEWLSAWGIQRDRIVGQCCQAVERYTGIEQRVVYDFMLTQTQKINQDLQQTLTTEGVEYVVEFVKGGIFLVSSVLVIFIFAVLLIKDMEDFQRKIQAIPATRMAWRIGKNIGHAGGRYIKAQGKIMLVVGAICVFGLWLLGNPHFLVWGIVIGVLDALPMLGVGIILIPWALIWLLRGNYWLALGYVGLFLIADLARQFLEPKILGKEIGLHPALMLVSVYGGVFVYGVAGFVLGPISVLILVNIWKELPK